MHNKSLENMSSKSDPHPGKQSVDSVPRTEELESATMRKVAWRLVPSDILSDLAAALTVSLGIAPTSNLNPEGKFPSMFEPIHGSAFDITGKGVANPIGSFWTGALLLDHLGEKKAAARLLSAIEAVVADKANHCPDLGGRATTRKVTDAVIAALKNPASTPHLQEPVTSRV
jgi:tartrate dehydrogenase/decarboxylase/D-malate dehydrogenase